MVDTGQMRREDTQFRLSQIAAAQKARGPHFALTNVFPTGTNIISRKRDVVDSRLALRDGHAETVPNDEICLFGVAWFHWKTSA